MTLPAATDVPATIRAILGPPALLSSEDAAIYEATLAHFAREIAPRDLIAWMLVKDLADHRLEIARYRRLRAAVVRNAFSRHVEKTVEDADRAYFKGAIQIAEFSDEDAAEVKTSGGPDVEQRCRAIDQEYWDDLDAADQRRRKTVDAIMAHNPTDREIAADLQHWIEGYQQLDRCLQAAEQRFIATLRDIERHVSAFGKTLRRIDVIEGEVLPEEAA